MPPTLLQKSAADNSPHLVARSVQAAIAQHPTLFYAALGFCCVSLFFGVVYLAGAVFGLWKLKGVNYSEEASGSRTEQASGLATGTCSWARRVRMKLCNSKSEHTRLRSPSVHVDTAAVPDWAARHLSHCRNIDTYAVPIPSVPTPATTATARTFSSSTCPVAPGSLVGLGLGNISFTSCHMQADEEYDVPPSYQLHDFDEVDITEHSCSIYSQDSEDSSDQFSPYVPMYQDVCLDVSPAPVFINGSPELLSPALGGDRDESYSSLAYLKQDTTHEYSPDFSIDLTRRDESVNLAYRNSPGTIRVKAQLRKPNHAVLGEDDKENAMLPFYQ